MSLDISNFAPGSRTDCHLSLSQQADGSPIEVPVCVVRGTTPGPVLWVNGALHGDETDGTAGLWRALDAIEPNQLRGTVVAVFVLNLAAFREMRRTSPADGVDINRVSPGRVSGGFTEQFVYEYLAAVRNAGTTHYMDLHGGGNTHDVVFYTIYREDDSESSRESRSMALAAGSGIIWRSKDTWLDHSILNTLSGEGVRAIIVEAGGEGKLREKYISAHCNSVLGVMTGIGMGIKSDVGVSAEEHAVQEADFFFSQTGGLWTSERTVGERVEQGELIGLVRDVRGRVQEEVCAKSRESVILALRTYAAITSGGNLGILGVTRR